MMKSEKCPCGSGEEFGACCGVILNGQRAARTAEELMRSRYTAYTRQDVDYVVETTHPDARTPDLAREIRAWMDQVLAWLGLHVLSTKKGAEGDREGTVEFVAEYLVGAGPGRLHECSQFRKCKGKWYYVAAEFISE